MPQAPCRRSAGPPKAVYLLGADDYAEEDVPEDAFVVYQVSGAARLTQHRICSPPCPAKSHSMPSIALSPAC